MRRLWTIGIMLLASARAFGADPGNVDLPRYPSISPDGRTIVFTWRGDLWRVDARGGHAMRLTSNPATELRSAWSPDGSLIAFESDRTGAVNLYTMRPDGRDIRAVTETDLDCSLSGFSGDGRALLFSASREGDVYRAERPYRVSLEGGPIERLHDAFGEFAQASPSGDQVLFTRGGSSWTRRHYMGPDARDVWVHGGNGFRQLTSWAGNDGMARWLDGDTVVFASDREGETVNLYMMSAGQGGERARRLTSFDRDVLSFDVARGSKTAVVSVWDRLYTIDLLSSTPLPTALTLTASEDERDNYERKDVRREVSAAALSPDGKVVALVAYGDVYIRHVDEDSPTRRVTSSPQREMEVAWSPDGTSLYFSGFDDAGTLSIFKAQVQRTRSDLKEAIEQP
ncbi:MAG: PD40 domain-containing protein, partial [Phycisphaerales bacterium]|nr:PD40 domain-containing protein [Phycisphaerales bacterium]